jgi:mannose-6-phosphate isomerase-like protein (cupin superfamily)
MNMHGKLLIAAGACALLLYGPVVSSQRAGQAVAPAPAVPNLPTGKTMFWAAAEIEGRWKENETLKRFNFRLFNGPTNISANVRIVLPDDPPLTHDTTADFWIVTAGSAIARTDGKVVTANGVPSISNGMQRTLHPGDVLYIPPGVPHHFTDVNGFRAWLMRFDTIGLVRTKPVPPAEAPAARAATPTAPAPPVPNAATDKTMFWPAADIVARWKDDEANTRINSRIFNAPANISANVRIVLPNDPPLAHVEVADLWLAMEGEAVARTDGEIVQVNGASTIRNAVARTMRPGDLLYIPPGVPHHFTDMKGFRAWLIRYDVEGWAQRTPAQ